MTRLAIYWNLGNFSKPVATISLTKSTTFLGNFCKGVRIFYFSSEIIFGQLLYTFGDFLLVTLLLLLTIIGEKLTHFFVVIKSVEKWERNEFKEFVNVGKSLPRQAVTRWNDPFRCTPPGHSIVKLILTKMSQPRPFIVYFQSFSIKPYKFLRQIKVSKCPLLGIKITTSWLRVSSLNHKSISFKSALSTQNNSY